MGELDDCVKKGLIRKMPQSKESAEMSISRARIWLMEAEAAFKAEIYDVCLLAAYEAMFHSARALLMRDGYRERSHYCMARYVDETYVKNDLLSRKVIEALDAYRELRHNAAYSPEFETGERDAKDSIKEAKMVIAEIGRLLEGSVSPR